jgi:hypothetical protein
MQLVWAECQKSYFVFQQRRWKCLYYNSLAIWQNVAFFSSSWSEKCPWKFQDKYLIRSSRTFSEVCTVYLLLREEWKFLRFSDIKFLISWSWRLYIFLLFPQTNSMLVVFVSCFSPISTNVKLKLVNCSENNVHSILICKVASNESYP